MNPNPEEKKRKSPAAGRHSRRWLPWSGAALLAAFIVAGLWPKPHPVETIRAARGALRSTVSEEGKTRIKNRYLVAAPVSGQLRRMTLKAGDAVEAGKTVVAWIDPAQPAILDERNRSLAAAKRDTASASLEKSRASHAFAAGDLKRLARLRAEGGISVQEYEAAAVREAMAAREVAASEGVLRQALAEMADFSTAPGGQTNAPPVELTAPASGKILHVFEENARVVAAGTRLLEIGDLSDIEVVVEVLSRDGAVIAPGTPVELDQWGGREVLKACVRLVEPAAFTKVSALGVEEQRVNVVADLLTPFEQRQSIGDNFRVEAHIIVWEAPDVLKAPSGALFRSGNQWAAYVVRNGCARTQTVKTGRSSGAETQILEGITESDTLILYPGDRIHDGVRVKPLKM
jgi:HlyD family secretion protein